MCVKYHPRDVGRLLPSKPVPPKVPESPFLLSRVFGSQPLNFNPTCSCLPGGIVGDSVPPKEPVPQGRGDLSLMESAQAENLACSFYSPLLGLLLLGLLITPKQ